MRHPAQTVHRSAARWLVPVLLVAVAAAGCGATNTTVPPPSVSASDYSLDATPWPNGTVGQYGLRIDPALLHKLPATVGGLPLLESGGDEAIALDKVDLPKSFDGYAAAGVGQIGDANWLSVTIGRLRPAAQIEDWYPSWRDSFAIGACSQADGVASTAQSTIADRTVDVSTCGGGVIVYSVQLDADYVLSLMDLGPRHLGRQLIENLP